LFLGTGISLPFVYFGMAMIIGPIIRGHVKLTA
jgi:hypothetical protein